MAKHSFCLGTWTPMISGVAGGGGWGYMLSEMILGPPTLHWGGPWLQKEGGPWDLSQSGEKVGDELSNQ